MSVTWEVSKLSKDWLKADAPKNMLFIVVTLDVSKLVNCWLKAEAPRNIRNMLVALEVSQPEISGLQVADPPPGRL